MVTIYYLIQLKTLNENVLRVNIVNEQQLLVLVVMSWVGSHCLQDQKELQEETKKYLNEE